MEPGGREHRAGTARPRGGGPAWGSAKAPRDPGHLRLLVRGRGRPGRSAGSVVDGCFRGSRRERDSRADAGGVTRHERIAASRARPRAPRVEEVAQRRRVLFLAPYGFDDGLMEVAAGSLGMTGHGAAGHGVPLRGACVLHRDARLVFGPGGGHGQVAFDHAGFRRAHRTAACVDSDGGPGGRGRRAPPSAAGPRPAARRSASKSGICRRAPQDISRGARGAVASANVRLLLDEAPRAGPSP